MIKNFTEIFIELCEERNLNQTDLANEIGINQSQISRYKKGIIPNIKNIVKICDYFNCSIDYIIGLNNNKTYKNLNKGYSNKNFYKEYQKLLNLNKINHYQLSKRNIVCETSLRLWKKGTLPEFEVICNIAYELGGSVDKMLGRI